MLIAPRFCAQVYTEGNNTEVYKTVLGTGPFVTAKFPHNGHVIARKIPEHSCTQPKTKPLIAVLCRYSHQVLDPGSMMLT